MSTYTIEKITNVFEDISIVDETEKDTAVEITIPPGEIVEEFSELDLLTFELLQLVEEYEKLTNESMRMNFVNGHLNLSRANYNAGSLSKKFGSESLDLRPRNAVKRILYTDKYEVIDMRDSETKTNAAKKSGSTEDNSNESRRTQEMKTSASGVSRQKNGNLRSRRKEKGREGLENDEQEKALVETKGSKEKTSEKSAPESKVYASEEVQFKDPIYQFGGMVPYQLRLAQTCFTKGLEDVVIAANLQKRIREVMQKVEDISRGKAIKEEEKTST